MRCMKRCLSYLLVVAMLFCSTNIGIATNEDAPNAVKTSSEEKFTLEEKEQLNTNENEKSQNSSNSESASNETLEDNKKNR